MSTAAIVATFDNFTTNTLASYTAANGYTLSHTASSAVNFGDGTDGVMSVSIPASNNTGTLVYNGASGTQLGTIDAGDVNTQWALTFSLIGNGANFKGISAALTLDGTPIASTAKSQATLALWDAAGTAPTGGTQGGGNWTSQGGQMTLNYTIAAGDVGKTLGWRINETGTSSGGSSYRIDNWNLAVVPEPSVALLGSLGMLGLLRRRRI